MTAETTKEGIMAPLPVWLYWLLVAFCAGLPVIIVSGAIPAPFDAIAAGINAACAALIGTSRPSPPIERAATKAAAAETLAAVAARRDGRYSGTGPTDKVG